MGPLNQVSVFWRNHTQAKSTKLGQRLLQARHLVVCAAFAPETRHDVMPCDVKSCHVESHLSQPRASLRMADRLSSALVLITASFSSRVNATAEASPPPPRAGSRIPSSDPASFPSALLDIASPTPAVVVACNGQATHVNKRCTHIEGKARGGYLNIRNHVSE